jgi:hypothetical protein
VDPIGLHPQYTNLINLNDGAGSLPLGQIDILQINYGLVIRDNAKSVEDWKNSS